MHLIGFHRLLIGVAIAFFAGYGLWEAAAFLRDGTPLRLLLAGASFFAAIGLLLYLRRLRHFLRLPPD